MTELIKTGELSNRYGVSTRTLRYYEEMGLLESQRIPDYAYRMYDDVNIKRLEQILILRKLSISIKDIQRIFNTSGSEIVLEVLSKKANDIDEEVALLHELKEIVIAFIRQIELADFTKDSDVKLLYEKAKEIETQLSSTEYTGNPSLVHRLLEVSEKLEEKAASRLQIPENILKRLLKNVYFIMGDGADVANELGSRYGIFVYHTCDYRYEHSQNADPKFQPELSRDLQDFLSLDPEDAMRRELGVVHDYTPMVIMDLIQLTAKYEKVICENDIDIENIIHIVSNAVIISNNKNWDDFIDMYENNIRRRDISNDEKDRLISKVDTVWGKGKPENPRGATKYGIKQIIRDDSMTIEQTAGMIAEYFGLKGEENA